jgi:xanthine dehydrogenase accessory factor
LIDDDQAKRYGLACGGQLELVFESLTDATSLRQILESLDRRERVKRCVSLGNNSAEITMATRTDQFRWNGEQLLQVFGPSWRVLIVGAGQLGRYAAEFAKALDFEVIVVDPRPAFRKAWRSPSVSLLSDSPDDAVISHANDPMSAVLALSHDPNLDDLALLEALPGKAFYVGALGSIRNYQKRCDRLSGLDLSADAVARLKGPIGLPIGSRTSAEIAISIMAELIQVRNSIL